MTYTAGRGNNVELAVYPARGGGYISAKDPNSHVHSLVEGRTAEWTRILRV